jgi:hypothetical protein
MTMGSEVSSSVMEARHRSVEILLAACVAPKTIEIRGLSSRIEERPVDAVSRANGIEWSGVAELRAGDASKMST